VGLRGEDDPDAVSFGEAKVHFVRAKEGEGGVGRMLG
jgi:hypothetical protein